MFSVAANEGNPRISQLDSNGSNKCVYLFFKSDEQKNANNSLVLLTWWSRMVRVSSFLPKASVECTLGASSD